MIFDITELFFSSCRKISFNKLYRINGSNNSSHKSINMAIGLQKLFFFAEFQKQHIKYREIVTLSRLAIIL